MKTPDTPMVRNNDPATINAYFLIKEASFENSQPFKQAKDSAAALSPVTTIVEA